MIGGLAAVPVLVRRLSGMLGYGLRRKKFPLFRLSARKGGFLRTRRIGRELKLGKFARLGRRYFFFLGLPAWPSMAHDRMAGRGGLNFAAAGSALKQHIDTAILAVTRRCSLACRHCYERVNIASADTVPKETWLNVIRRLQDMSTGVIVLSGGEPMMAYPEVLELVRGADKDLSDVHIHTSGRGVTPGRARELRRAGLTAAGVGLDDVDPARHNALRGSPDSYREAVGALRHFHEAGVFTYTNTCLTKELVRSGDIWALLDMVRGLGAGAVRLLEPKPCGGYFGTPAEELFSEADRTATTDMFIRANTMRKHRSLPLVCYEAYFESPAKMGCMMGGLSHFSIDGRGYVIPCVFLPVAFGNILTEDVAAICSRMRAAIPRPLRRECPANTLAGAIKQKTEAGLRLPVPFEALEDEWTALWRRS